MTSAKKSQAGSPEGEGVSGKQHPLDGRSITEDIPFEEWKQRLERATNRRDLLSMLHAGMERTSAMTGAEKEERLLLYFSYADGWNHFPSRRDHMEEYLHSECKQKAFIELARHFSKWDLASSRALFECALTFFLKEGNVPAHSSYKGALGEAASSMRRLFFEFSEWVWHLGSHLVKLDKFSGSFVQTPEDALQFRQRCRGARARILSVWLDVKGENEFWMKRLPDFNGVIQKMLFARLMEVGWNLRQTLQDGRLSVPEKAARFLLWRHEKDEEPYAVSKERHTALILVLAPHARCAKAAMLRERRLSDRRKREEEARRQQEIAEAEQRAKQAQEDLLRLKSAPAAS